MRYECFSYVVLYSHWMTFRSVRNIVCTRSFWFLIWTKSDPGSSSRAPSVSANCAWRLNSFETLSTALSLSHLPISWQKHAGPRVLCCLEIMTISRLECVRELVPNVLLYYPDVTDVANFRPRQPDIFKRLSFEMYLLWNVLNLTIGWPWNRELNMVMSLFGSIMHWFHAIPNATKDS
jgi:hypothetical protein